MRAIQCRAWGEIDNLALVDIPSPDKPGPGEILVDVAAAGVNFADLLMTAGKYQERPMPPFTPGFEIAGTVHDIGADVSRLKPGNRVLALLDRGGFAEQAIAREADTFILPDAMDFATAAGFAIAYGTSHGALTWRAALKPNELLLVLGAARSARPWAPGSSPAPVALRSSPSPRPTAPIM
jgi:NADPH:quinone reductase